MLGARLAVLRRGLPALLALAGLLLGPAGATARAPVCAGDCNGDGGITVAELIQGVRIGLGDDPLERCQAFDADGDGVLRIEELVRAVAGALVGCPATPTASPTHTPTVPAATASTTVTDTPTEAPTPSATPTATVPSPDVSGTWREDPLRIVSSTCLRLLTDEFAAELAARPACAHEVTQAGNRASVVDCNGERTDGDVDALGTIRLAFPVETGNAGGCRLALATRATIDAASSPTTALYTFDLSFSGACPVADCTMIGEGIWTRIGSTSSPSRRGRR